MITTVVRACGLIFAASIPGAAQAGNRCGSALADYRAGVHHPIGQRIHATGYRTIVGGITIVTLTIDRQGRVVATRLVQPSGVDTIDRVAMGAVPVGEHLPAIPSCLEADSMTFTVPLRFQRG